MPDTSLVNYIEIGDPPAPEMRPDTSRPLAAPPPPRLVAGTNPLDAASAEAVRQNDDAIRMVNAVVAIAPRARVSTTNLFFDAGMVQDVSAGSARRQRNIDYLALRPFRDDAEEHLATVNAEARREFKFPIATLAATAEGIFSADSLEPTGILRQNGHSVGGIPTPTAWRHIADRINAYGSPAEGLGLYLATCSPALRPDIVKAELLRAAENARDTQLQMKMATRAHPTLPGKREVYRGSSPSYAALEATTVLPALMALFPAGSGFRSEMTYNRQKCRLTIDVTMQCPIEEPGRVGEMVRVGWRLVLDDAKAGAVRVTFLVIRERCLNGSEAPAVAEVTMRHIGTTDRQMQRLMSLVGNTRELARSYTDKWASAWQDRIIDESMGRGPEAVFRALLDADLVKASGRKEQAVQSFLRAWEVEPGYSRADVVNAITRAAHDNGEWWSDLDVSEGLERAGGELLYVNNLVRRVDAAIAMAA